MIESSNYFELITKLDNFIRKFYKNQLLKGSIYSLALLSAFYLATSLLEYYGQFDIILRTTLFYLYVALAGYILTVFIFIPLVKLFQFGKIISYDEAAIIIGNHFPEVKDKLTNTLQLSRSEAGNSDLLQASINQKISGLSPIPFSSAINLSENKRYLKYLVPPVITLVSLLFVSPSVITDSTARLIHHRTYFEKQAPFHFIVENASLDVVQQNDFELNIKVEGTEIPEIVYVESENTQFKLKKNNTISFSHTFKKVQQSIKFRLFADEFHSKEYVLNVFPNPVLLSFTVELNYPAYTGKKKEIIHNTGDIIAPEGTLAKWFFNTKNTDQLSVNFTDTTYKIMAGGNSGSLSSRIFKNQRYSIRTENTFYKNPDSIAYTINVIPDLYPSIENEEKADSVDSQRIYFRGTIKDDYGFKGLKFVYTFTKTEDSLKLSAKTNEVELNINKTNTTEFFYHVWNLTPLAIVAGEEIEYYFEVFDNDGVHGSKSTRSKLAVFKAPTLKELAEKKNKDNQETKKSLEESIVEAQDLQQDLKKLQQKLVDKKKLSWEDKKQMEQLLNKQKELEKELGKLENETKKSLNEQMEYTQMDPVLIEKQKKLQEMFEQIMTDEMKELFRQMQDMMEELDKNKLQDMMEKMELSSKDIEKELDRTLEVFKQLEFEQKLQDNLNKLSDLQEKQENLSEKSEEKNADSEALEKEQEKLNKEFEELKKEMSDLEKKNEELEFPNKMESTDQEEENIEKEMQKSAEELNNKQNKKASQSQKNASNEMKKMADKLKKMQEEMDAEGNAEDMVAMRQLLENLVQLSFEQEELMNELNKLENKDPNYVRVTQKQKKIKDDAKMIEDSLFALSKRVPEIASSINREMSAVNQNMEKAIASINEAYTNQGNKPMAASKQQLIMTSLNNLALLFDEIVQQMQQQMAEQKYGNSSCNKPGKGKSSPSSMRKMQEQMNKQMQQMKERMEKEGNLPNGKQGKGGSMSMELAKMAAQQEALRNELKKLSDKLSEENGTGGKGHLEKVQELMEQTETDLVNRRITQETLNRQQEILTRLLESEKADRERDLDEKRESKEGKGNTAGNPNDFFEYNQLKKRETELLKTVPPSLNNFYKNKVSDYFKSF